MRKAIMVAALLWVAPAYAQAQQDSGDMVAEHWRQLGDSTLNRLMDEALLANQDVRAAQARVRGARAFRSGAALDLVPTVTASGGYTRFRSARSIASAGPGTFPDQDLWDGGFDAIWELDLFGRLRHAFKAQGRFVAAAREDLRDVQVILMAELARVYFELRGAQGQLAVARQNGENQRRTLEVTRQRLDAGGSGGAAEGRSSHRLRRAAVSGAA